VSEQAGVELVRELESTARRERLARDVREGLGRDRKRLEPKYFYDERGSRLFRAITRLPEYYQTRTERSILERLAPELVEERRPRAVVEYGSGGAGKTRLILDAMSERDLLEGYGPIDVSASALREAAHELVDRYPGLRVVGIIGDFETPLELPFADLPRLVLFLGSTIGNLREERAVRFLERVRRQMRADDGFLIGFDLVKDRKRLVAAYDDGQRVTAEFNRNVLRVLNRELDADFRVEAYRHEARWNEARSRIEMHLVADRPQRVWFGDLEMEVELEAGESIRTELSYKYTRESATELLAEAGFRVVRWETDPAGLFALGLAEAGSDGGARSDGGAGS